jgi:hypothetical protein
MSEENHNNIDEME